VVCEFTTVDEDFFTSTNSAHVWIDVRHDRFFIVSKGEASFAPVNAIETDFEGKTSICANSWR